MGGLDSGSGLLGTAGDWALAEFSWATSGPISRLSPGRLAICFPYGVAGPAHRAELGSEVRQLVD